MSLFFQVSSILKVNDFSGDETQLLQFLSRQDGDHLVIHLRGMALQCCGECFLADFRHYDVNSAGS